MKFSDLEARILMDSGAEHERKRVVDLIREEAHRQAMLADDCDDTMGKLFLEGMRNVMRRVANTIEGISND